VVEFNIVSYDSDGANAKGEDTGYEDFIDEMSPARVTAPPQQPPPLHWLPGIPHRQGVGVAPP